MKTFAGLALALELPSPSAEPPPEAGRLGRYTVLGELGRGGMGRVLLALDPEIGREVAIKVILQGQGIDRDTLDRFVAEARITGQLEHPNIVPIYDVGVTDAGQVYTVMRRVQGRGLNEVLPGQPGAWTLHRLLSAFQAVCAALSFAHHQGVTHQDIKPQNIILGPFDEVLVLDWGLAALLRGGLRVSLALPSPRGVVGTPGFIAPERITSPQDPPSPLSDQWSLGALLYTLLCGHSPYSGENSRVVLEATLRGPPEDVRLRDPEREVPFALGEICQRAMDPDPARRFPDVGALGAAVRAYQEGAERRQRALALVAEADTLAPQIAAQRAQAQQLHAQDQARLATVKASAPVAEKREAWALQDAASAAQSRAELDQLVWEQRLQGALQLVPDLHEAHVRLAQQHRQALEAAEARHDPSAAARAEWLLRQHDRGHHRRWLLGTGSLTLHTDPPGAHARLWRFELHDRQLRPVSPKDLGPTPLLDVPLAPGSYLVELERPGHHPVRYPVCIGRAMRWDGVRPGETEPYPVPLPPLGALGPEERYVPAGWFQAGGDPEAPDALSARRVWVDGFVCRRAPVTNTEYVTFLSELPPEEQEELLPRDVQRPSHPLEGTPTFALGPDGRWGPPAGVDPTRWGQLPLVHVNLHMALRFAQRCGGRLPDELEREKAARGVDGRHYPWGDHHDPAFSCIAPSQALPLPTPVSEFPLDESVYGVRGLAGNVRDLCGNRWTEQGPAADGERLVLRPADLEVDFLAVRGGAWSGTARLARSAARFGDPPGTRFPIRGLRLVRSWG